jgi:hypothetical protein
MTYRADRGDDHRSHSCVFNLLADVIYGWLDPHTVPELIDDMQFSQNAPHHPPRDTGRK